MDDRAALKPIDVPEPPENGAARAPLRPIGGLFDSADFASRRAARGKMQLWLTTFTVVAALAVLVVVSVSVLQPG